MFAPFLGLPHRLAQTLRQCIAWVLLIAFAPLAVGAPTGIYSGAGLRAKNARPPASIQAQEGETATGTLDGHGSVRFLTNESGAVTDTYTYDAFGELIHRQGTTASDYLYCGERYIGSLALYHLRARMMSTNYGRFWNMDTFEGHGEDPTSLHKYLYCAPDPVNNLDPSGYSTNSGEASATAGIAVTLARFTTMAVYRAMNYVLLNATRIDSATRAVLFYIDVFAITAGAVLATADILDGMAGRLLDNDKPISVSYGNAVEDIAEGNLRGNVKAIDHFDEHTGAAVSIKAHDLDSPEKLAKAIEVDLKALKNIENQRLAGNAHDGRRIDIPPGTIKAKGLLVGVPESSAGQALNPRIRSMLISYRQNYNVIIRVVPVKNWLPRSR